MKKDAWLVKNSYDTDRGESGYIWSKYSSNYIAAFAAWIDGIANFSN